MDKERFSEIGRVEAIRRLYEGSGFEMAEAGSFKIAGPGRIGSWSRLFIEGIDFSLIYFPLRHLGYKCVSALAGEVYASFSHPRSLDVKIGVSAKLDFSQISELWQGITTAASEHRFLSLSLDLLPSPNGLTIAVSATGEESKLQESRRPEAKSKDLLCVSGSLGAAYFGLSLLEKAAVEREKLKKQAVTAGEFTIISESGEADAEVEAKIRARQDAKKAKNFAEADRIREELKAAGIEVTDIPHGAKWKRI